MIDLVSPCLLKHLHANVPTWLRCKLCSGRVSVLNSIMRSSFKYHSYAVTPGWAEALQNKVRELFSIIDNFLLTNGNPPKCRFTSGLSTWYNFKN